ncbi:serine hydrolase domain-containing protein [Yinghuangia seranimata]|uniref:serine hydrolase domain-containing protein n=1 Tax=Yinghuangia seranimata TaxID=408067 RepID=UPI00248AF8E1|nr:serine hydrolase domain-containing protein [Yinghuangia seranimata]MDI2129008.1 serine hydrolase domain-containing protein [Yinghuangia seranimata]
MQNLVQQAVDQLVESGAELGVQVAVYRHGELVVDAVAGVADPGSGRPVTSDVPFYSASTAKGVTATVVHVLADRGALSYETPIVELWPEFGAHGKGKATVRHALTHSVGVPAVPSDLTVEDLADWDRMCAVIAGSEPWWEPGTKTGYHAMTWGFVMGEIVRRATGKPISQVLVEEVAGPLGVADELFFGVPESELGRLARLKDAPGSAEMMAAMPADMPLLKATPPAVTPSAAYGNNPVVLTSDIPSGGTMSARAVARMYAALMGEVDGVRLVSDERLREITALATADVDQMVGFPMPRALGYNLGRPGADPQATLGVFGMPGMGGSAAYADTATGIAFALTKNRFFPGPSAAVDQIGELVAKAAAG